MHIAIVFKSAGNVGWLLENIFYFGVVKTNAAYCNIFKHTLANFVKCIDRIGLISAFLIRLFDLPSGAAHVSQIIINIMVEVSHCRWI